MTGRRQPISAVQASPLLVKTPGAGLLMHGRAPSGDRQPHGPDNRRTQLHAPRGAIPDTLASFVSDGRSPYASVRRDTVAPGGSARRKGLMMNSLRSPIAAETAKRSNRCQERRQWCRPSKERKLR